jgi:hypothetical protein
MPLGLFENDEDDDDIFKVNTVSKPKPSLVVKQEEPAAAAAAVKKPVVTKKISGKLFFLIKTDKILKNLGQINKNHRAHNRVKLV